MSVAAQPIGRIHMQPGLDPAEVVLLATTSQHWEPSENGGVLVPRDCADQRVVADALRRLITDFFKPREIVLDGAVVIEGEEQRIFSIKVWANRVCAKEIWAGKAVRERRTPYQPPAGAFGRGACEVIDLDARRAAKG